jgi:hypothetical protein
MGFSGRALALAMSLALLAGCFGYNRGAKGWSYVGDAVLLAAGGAAIAVDRTSSEEPCTGDNCQYKSPLSGLMVAGVVLAAAGLFGIVFNATRDEVKTSR